MAELAGVAAQLVTGGDVNALAEAIEEATTGGGAVRSRVDAGLAIAAAHTWQASAEGHLGAYRLAKETAAAKARPRH
jgi:hypothetical protein